MKKALMGPAERNAFRDNYLAAIIAVAALLLSFTATAQKRSQLQQINATGYTYKAAEFRIVTYLPLDSLHGADSGAIAYKQGKLWISKDTLTWQPYGKAIQINDSSFIVGVDTITIHGTGVTPVTASNGLTRTVDDIQLGSDSYPGAPLTSQRYIDADVFGILINRSNASGSAIPLQVYDDGAAGQAAFTSNSVNNASIIASSTNQTAVGISSTNGMGAQISSMNNKAALFITNPTSTNSAENVITLQRNTQGTAANGLGLIIDMQLQSAGGFTSFSNSIVSKWTNATNRTSILEFYGSNSGTQSRKAALAGNGQWVWPEYPGLTHQTDTTTYKPIAYDGSGNIVPMAGWPGAGGASGSAGGDLTGTYPNPTLATVNSNTGTFYNPYYTVNGKGLITASGEKVIRTVTTNTSSAAADAAILCNTASGDITVTISTTTSNMVTIQKISSDFNTVIISPSSGTIRGGSTYVLTGLWESVTIFTNGTNFYIKQ